MLGLLLASIWTWAIIISFSRKLKAARDASARFEQDFAQTSDMDKFHKANEGSSVPAFRVFAAGIREWRRSTAGSVIDREGTRQRLVTAMGAATAAEVDALADRINVLATVGAVAPFVGLFTKLSITL